MGKSLCSRCWNFDPNSRWCTMKSGFIMDAEEKEIIECSNFNEYVTSYSKSSAADAAEMVEQRPETPDMVNHPSHYTQGGIECLEAIRAALGEEGYQKYLAGNILKYVWRYPFKNGVEDLKKAQFYLNCIIESLESGPPK